MTKQVCEVLKRADRVLAGAFVLALSASAAIMVGHNVPSTEQVASGTRDIAHGAQQLAGETGRVALGTVERSENEAAHVMSILPASSVIASQNIVEPLKSMATPSLATEATIIRVLQDQRCLAEAMYYEARGEGRAGEEAIAEVIFHRTRSAGYPRTICGVVYQGAGLNHGCQFSFACDGEMRMAKTPGAWMRARALAARIMAGVVRLGDVTENAISFHAADVQPDWADHLERTIQIGNHIFYRAAPRTKAS